MSSNGINLLRMANSYLRNMVTVEIYKTLNLDLTRPTRVIAQLNNECNSKCSMCDVWREKRGELPARIWITALKQLKSNLGYFTVGFAGGEILLKDDVFEIFEFCNNVKLPFTITTNGRLLSAKNIERLLKLNPLNINISLDSLENNVYREIRGVSFLESVKSNIDYLMKYINQNNLSTKVFLKTVVNNLNLNELASIANYSSAMQMAGITFDPLRRRRRIFKEKKIDAFEEMAKIDPNSLKDSVEQLISLKKKGINVFNSERRMRQWFNKPNTEKEIFCSAPLRDIYINSEGYVRLCDYTDSQIGNISIDDISILLKSEAARIEKKMLTRCSNPCDYCIHRNLFDYFRLFLGYLKN
jgi:MoaA/NifB/PqqE/SkfB family radical SAM enzyme